MKVVLKEQSRIANKLCLSMATIYKERSCPNQITKMVLMGDVKDKTCILVDDMIDTAGTACKAAEVLKENGAKDIYMLVSHGILSGPAMERISSSKFTKVVISNSLEQDYKTLSDKIDIFDISWMCGEAMKRSLYGESLKELYDSKIDDNIFR